MHNNQLKSQNIIPQKKYTCPGCGFVSSSIYDFSPSIQIGPGDFRFFHLYSGMRGAVYCVQCKRKHLMKIAKYKNLSQKNIEFLKNEIKNNASKFNIKKR